MFEFHGDKKRYFDIQYQVSKDYIIPYLKKLMPLDQPRQVLEIGCAEAGVLKAFIEEGHQCIGIELNPHRVKLAESFLAKELKAGKIKFITRDIHEIDIQEDIGHGFDLIILKDVIEHIHDQEKFIKKLHVFLNPGGKVFFGFPPWQMPYGGHQQICRSRFLSKLPYFHLFPRTIYKLILRSFGETPERIEDLLEIKDTGISLERFERLLKDSNYQITNRKLFLINPIYKYKFNIKTRTQNALIAGLPFVRNFLTTCGYYLIEKKA